MEFNIQPSILVIFGATGDLARRRLMPALLHLYERGVLPRNMRIIGFARRDISGDAFRKMMEGHQRDKGELEDGKKFSKLLSYVRGDFTALAGYLKLSKLLGRQDAEWKFCANKLFYLAVPPRYYETILDNLAESGLTEPCGPNEGWTRVILEKPFGKDLAGARRLDEKLAKLFREEQIFRIDHFLGKESLQNILAFRFGNAIFAPVWNRNFISQVQIIAAEKSGIEGRGAFYDDVGALRDMVQSHLLQMVAVVAMERPQDFTAQAIRKERARVLQAVTLSSGESERSPLQVVRGQYGGYRGEPGVAGDAQTETLVALKLLINNDRWRGVPFYLLTGKKLKRDLTRIVIEFKAAGGELFTDKRTQVRAKVGHRGRSGGGWEEKQKQNRQQKNRIVIEMKPRKWITVEVLMKEPGLAMKIAPHPFKLDYGSIHEHALLDAYEKLLIDCMTGDQTLFASTEEVIASWKLVMPLLESWRHWQQNAKKQHKDYNYNEYLESYAPGSWGPAGAKRLLGQDGRMWLL